MAGGLTWERYLLCSSKIIFFSSSLRDQLSCSTESIRRTGQRPELSIVQAASALSSPRLWQSDLKHLPKARNTQQPEDWGGNVFITISEPRGTHPSHISALMERQWCQRTRRVLSLGQTPCLNPNPLDWHSSSKPLLLQTSAIP